MDLALETKQQKLNYWNLPVPGEQNLIYFNSMYVKDKNKQHFMKSRNKSTNLKQ